MSVFFRRITSSEAVGSAGIIVQAYREPPWFEQWSNENASGRLHELTTTPDCLSIGAILDGAVIGFAFALPHTSVNGRGIVIAEIAILPEHQRRGIGRALLQRTEQEARASGFRHVWLVSQRSGGVADYYHNNGYAPSSKLGVYTKPLVSLPS